MIKETYVSYETAELLKEKGFNESTLYHYTNCDVLQHNIVYNKYKNSEMLNAYSAPTHQMAMAWLREKHKLFILVGWLPIQKEYFTRIFDMTDLTPKRNLHEHADYNEAVDEAIKFCLENLI